MYCIMLPIFFAFLVLKAVSGHHIANVRFESDRNLLCLDVFFTEVCNNSCETRGYKIDGSQLRVTFTDNKTSLFTSNFCMPQTLLYGNSVNDSLCARVDKTLDTFQSMEKKLKEAVLSGTVFLTRI